MLIKTIAEIKEYIRITAIANFDQSFKPFVKEVEQIYIIKYLGQAQYDELQVYYDLELDNIPALTALLENTQRPLTKFLLKHASSFIDIEISEGGFTVNDTQTALPASQARVEKLMKVTYMQGWDTLEILIKFLEDNVSDFPLWAASDAYILSKSTLIQSAGDFDKFYTIHESRLWFFNAKSIMRDVEQSEVISKISQALYDTILGEINTDTISAATEAILPNLKRAISHYTYARDSVINKKEKIYSKSKPVESQDNLVADADKINRMADFYMNKVMNTITTNIDDYPDYKNSDLYDADFEPYENTAESKIFKAGGAQ